MNDSERGRRDAELFTEIHYTGGAWSGVLQSTGAEALILEPVTPAYLASLSAGGCRVEFPRRGKVAA